MNALASTSSIGAAPPQQLGFLEEAPATPPMRLAIAGALTAPATLRALGDSTGRLLLSVQLAQPYDDSPTLNAHQFIEQADRGRIERLAATLRAGELVMVHGAGIVVDGLLPAGHSLRLVDCYSINRLEIGDPQ